MNQPHLSKIIRELERDLGCPIFDRTSRGMIPTVRGEEFLRYAKGIMEQEAQLDKLCSRNKECPREIRLCGPRASYISSTLKNFLKEDDRLLRPMCAIKKRTPRTWSVWSLPKNLT